MTLSILRRGAALALSTLALQGCAVYEAAPLQGAAEDALTQPERAALTVAAASLQHPRLAPVALDFTRPLTPEELAVIAVVASPDLKAARARAGLARAQVFSAGLLPDPTLNLGFDKVLSGPDTFIGLAGQLALDLIAYRDRGVVRAGAAAAQQQVRLDIAWQEWQYAGQAHLLAARIGGLEQVYAIDLRSRDLAQRALTRALNAAARGDVPASEVEARRIAALDTADRLRIAERDLAIARLDLNKLLGVRPDTRIQIAPASPASPQLDPERLFLRARTERLDLAALERGYSSQAFVVRRAVLTQFPVLQLSVNAAQDTAGNRTLGPSVNFSLPVFNRNRGGIAVAKATQAQLRAEYAARVFATRAEIATLVSNLRLAERQRAEITAQVVPLERMVRDTESAAARGDLALVVAETARQSLSDKQLVLATLAQTIAEQTATLQIAVGASLNGTPR